MNHVGWCGLLAAAVTFASTACSSGRPNDELLISEFQSGRKAYREVVETFLSSGLHRFEILSNGAWHSRPDVSFDGAKLARILGNDLRLNLVSVYFLVGSFDRVNEIAFFNYRSGMVFAGEHKGVVYVVDESVLSDVVGNLDAINRNDPNVAGKRFYRRIAEHWYLFYEYFP